MVVPLGLPSQITGSPPAELQGPFRHIKICVIFDTVLLLIKTIALIIVEGFVVWDIVLPSLNTFVVIVLGVFLLRDDPLIGRLYTCFLKTCCYACADHCNSGTVCLLPYAAFSTMATLWDLIVGKVPVTAHKLLVQAESFANVDGVARIVFVFAMVSVLVVQAASSWFAWRAYRLLRDMDDIDSTMGAGVDRMSARPRSAGSAVSTIQMQEVGGRRSSSQQSGDRSSFQPFSGTGHKLGD